MVRLVAGLGLLGWILVATEGWRAFERLATHPLLLAAFVGQTFFGALIEAQRLVLLVRSQNVALGIGRSLCLVATSALLSYVVPGGVGGDVAKVAGLGSDHGGRRVEFTVVILVDRVCGMMSLLTVACIAAIVSGSLPAAPAPLRATWAAAIVVVIAEIAGFLLAWSPAARASAIYRFVTTRLPLHRVISRLADAVYAFRNHKGAIIGAVVLTAIGHLTLMGVFVLAARVMMPDAPSRLVAWVSLLALVANLLPLTPGGLGVGEAAFSAAFRLAGYAGGALLLISWRAGLIPLAALGALSTVNLGRHPRTTERARAARL